MEASWRYSRQRCDDLRRFQSADYGSRQKLAPLMLHDVDLMRDLLFVLEKRQTSPRATVFIAIDDEAYNLARSPEEVESGLNTLLDLDYIDGPGVDEPGFWLFRKLTRKGVAFVRATRSPREWDRIKQRFANEKLSHGA